MLTGLDHPIIAVRDLDHAAQAYARLGFEVMRGGRNPGLGTYNALIRFGLQYLELLSVDDREAALHVHPRGPELVDFLERRGGGLLSFVAASDAIDDDVARAEAHGFVGGQAVPMQRMRPDGNVLRWKLLIPGEVSFRQPWPLLIQWDTPDAVRVNWETPGVHANGAVGIVGLALAVRSLDAARDLYAQQLGLPVGPVASAVELDATYCTVDLPNCPIDLLEPSQDGPLADALFAEGEGPYHVRLGVRDLEATQDHFTSRGASFQRAWPGGLVLDMAETCGARLVFQEVT